MALTLHFRTRGLGLSTIALTTARVLLTPVPTARTVVVDVLDDHQIIEIVVVGRGLRLRRGSASDRTRRADVVAVGLRIVEGTGMWRREMELAL